MSDGDPSEHPHPLVCSIVINYNGGRDTIRCVDSLMKVEGVRHRIVVVDNASTHDDVSLLTHGLDSSVHLEHSPFNGGYGAAANLGMGHARRIGATYAWILNNDTTVEPKSLEALVAVMRTTPEAAVCSPQILAPISDEAPMGVWYAGGTADFRRATTRHDLMPMTAGTVVETRFVTGCAMLLRIEMVDAVGGFWEPLFLYWEDADLCRRLSDRGGLLFVVADARIQHYPHGSVSSEIARRFYVRNAIILARRHGSWVDTATAATLLAIRIGRGWLSSVIRRGRPPVAETKGLALGVIALMTGGPSRR